MKVISTLTLLAVAALTGCSSTNQAVGTSRPVDYDNRPLPIDQQNLALQGAEATIHFRVPAGWHIQSQPTFNHLSYTLTHSGTFGYLPYLNISLETGDRGHLSQARSHAEHLLDIQTNYSSASCLPAGNVRLSDGRTVAIMEYAQGDVPELAAFVPGDGHVTAFSIQAETSDELLLNRSAFEEVIQSYRAK